MSSNVVEFPMKVHRLRSIDNHELVEQVAESARSNPHVLCDHTARFRAECRRAPHAV